MTLQDDQTLFATDVAAEALAMNEAALQRDFDEARFRARMVVGKAYGEGCFGVAAMAARIVDALGEPGTTPRHGYGELMLQLAHLIGTLVREPLQQGTA
ncbi:hypothetical protein BJI69_13615 [Luteibacter rhizovicinus DSM 16549]|uniref:Uncharacterized protein n=1 Tax=Luteibacter rhizovicinus DSM 16549 TaxID=1440763 RepID=A0A0G9HDY6_9GAMM|nr:hypothetical protein [Luteibacter rhizovicinus]APG04827.1 hypothetical protein BJI69_13615 [Luteibacter rhizovicinus DSM 16549]KLD67414.1 hypothetical protein Y883_07915 [Luteibacter rhizovicinus DSM 16549]KLD73968.1 hypothetical protein Y886_35190 [Xanthomonas hyacinthi DSM 19077]